MRISHFFFLLSLCLWLGCSSKTTEPASTTAYKAPAPAVSTSPQPTTAESLPPDPNAPAAPATYGPPGMTPRAAAPTTYASAAAVAAPIVGSWVNASDPDEMVIFTDHSYASYYEGQPVVQEEMTYHVLCPGDCSGGVSAGVPCFTITSPYGTDCFGIIRVTENELELSLLGVSTETVTYSRINP